MFSLGADDDDMDFMPASGGLKSLFGGGRTASSGSSESLKFSAPKQPKPEQKPDSASSGVLFATVGQTYQYQNNNYVTKGKLGIAVTGSKSIIIYGQKQRIVSNCKLTPESVFTTTAANFVTYYDDLQQCWGVMFTGEKDLETFLQHITLVRFSLKKQLLKQQLNYVEAKQPVGSMDTVLVAYTGWLIEQEKTGQQFDTNESFLVRLSPPSVIRGWVESLPGCVECGVYFIVIPATLAYKEKGIVGRIPPNSDLTFRITIKQITPVATNLPTSPVSVSNDFTDSSSVESFPVTRNSQPGDNQKNEILTRIARMGAQPALPITLALPSSPEPDQESRSRTSSVKSNRSKRKARSSSSVVVEDRPPQIPTKPGPLVPHYNGPAYHAAFQNYPPVAHQLIATTTPELKENLDISKSVDKSVTAIEASLKEVEAKLGVLSQQAILFNNTVSSCPTVDTQLLMFNLQRIVSENESLKCDVKNKTITLEERSNKITELLNKNQELMNLKNEALEVTQNNFLVNSNQASKEIERLEHENEQLRNELKVFRSSTNDRQFEIDAKQDQLNSLRKQMESLYSENNKLQMSLFETRNELSALRVSSSSDGGQELILQNEIKKLKERVQSSLLEKLEISQQLDDQQFNEKQASLQYEKKIKQLKQLLEESQSSSGNDNLIAENKRLEEENSEFLKKSSDQKAKLLNLVQQQKEEKERHTNLENELRETVSVQHHELDKLNSTIAEQCKHIESLTQIIKEKEQLPQTHQARGPDENDDEKEKLQGKVKQILNNVFRKFREEIDIDESYEGRSVLNMTMNIIKNATLSMIRDSSDDESSDDAVDESSEGDDNDDGDDDNENGAPDNVPSSEGENNQSDEIIPSSTLNSTEFEIPGSSTDFLHVEPTNSGNDTFYSTFSPDNGRDCLYSDAIEGGETSGNPVEISENLEHQIQEDIEPENNDEREQDLDPGHQIEEQEIDLNNGDDRGLNTEEFEAREEEDLWMAAPPSEPPPSPSPVTFEPNLQHTTVSVEDIAHLSTEVFGARPEAITTSPSNARRETASNAGHEAPPPLFSDSEDDVLDM